MISARVRRRIIFHVSMRKQRRKSVLSSLIFSHCIEEIPATWKPLIHRDRSSKKFISRSKTYHARPRILSKTSQCPPVR